MLAYLGKNLILKFLGKVCRYFLYLIFKNLLLYMQSVAPQINYKAVEPSANPKYRFLRIPLNNITGGSFTIGATTSQLMEWKLPNSVYNLAQSYIGYQVATAAQAAGVVSWIHEDCLEIATNAYFGTAGGLDLCNLNYVNRYTKVWRKARTPFSEFISKDTSSQLYPCNAAAGDGNPDTANPIGFGTSSTNYLEPRYLRASVANTARTNHRLFRLDGIVDTLFSVDKDIYFPVDMYIRMTAGVGNQIAFGSDLVTDPKHTPTAITGNITIQNCYLYLAVEQNELIVQSVMNKVLTSGLKLTIPYTTAWRNTNTGTVANIQISLTQQFGKKLKRMIHTVWDPTESANTSMDCANTNGLKVSGYNTFLDQRQLQDYQLSCVAAGTAPTYTLLSLEGDWRENKGFCQGSAILNRSVYQLNWFHCDQFYQSDLRTGVDDSHHDDGLVMDSAKLWSFQGNVAGALTHYNFATFVRQVMVDRNGVSFV